MGNITQNNYEGEQLGMLGRKLYLIEKFFSKQ